MLSFSLVSNVIRECLFGVKMSRKESRESGQRGNSGDTETEGQKRERTKEKGGRGMEKRKRRKRVEMMDVDTLALQKGCRGPS